MSALASQDCTVAFIDLQVGSLSSVSTRSPDEVAAAAGALADVASLHGIPMLVTVGRKPGPGAALIPELTQRLHDAHPIERTLLDAFDDPDFASAVKDTGRGTLILAGVALDIGVVAAALSARKIGHQVYIVAEACATTDALAEATALARLAAADVHWIGFAALALGLMRDFAGPHAKETQALVHRLAPSHRSAHD